MKQSYLLINEVAQLLDVTTHTLRFYEKKGIISPVAVTDKGYRLYDYNVISKLEEILMLRSLDMSINQITEYLDCKSTDRYIDQLKSVEEEVNNRIETLTLIKQQIHQKIDLASAYETNKDALYIHQYPKRHLLLIGKIDDPFDHHMDEKELFQLLKSKLPDNPLKSSMDLIYLSKDDDTNLYLLIDASDMKHLDPASVHTLPSGDYLCGFHQATTLKTYMKFLNKVETYLKKSKLKSADYLLDFVSSDYGILESDKHMTHFQLLIIP